MTSKRGKLAFTIAGAIGDAPRPAPKPPLFDSRDSAPDVAKFHITYTARDGSTQTGRVYIQDDRRKSASELRRKAIQAAAWKFDCYQSTIRAVRVYPKGD